MTFIRPDYGVHQAQHQEWLELTGLWEPCRDPDHKPAQGTVRFPEPVTSYPLDDFLDEGPAGECHHARLGLQRPQSHLAPHKKAA